MDIKKQNIVKEEVLQIIKNHPMIILFNLPLFIGGLIIVVYLLHIKYFPVITPSDALLLFLLSAVVGICLFSFISLIMIIPVISYQGCSKIMQFEKELEQQCLENMNKNEIIDNKEGNLNKFTIMKKIVVSIFSSCYEKKQNVVCNPGRILLLISLNTGLIISLGFFYLYTKIDSYGWLLLVVNLLSIALVCLWIFYKQFKVLKPNESFDFELFMIYLKNIYISIFFQFFVLYLLLNLLQNSVLRDNSYLLIAYLLMYTFIFTLIGVFTKKIWKQVLMAAFMLSSLMIILNIPYIIPNAIMKMFSIGQVKVDRVVFNKEGCQVFVLNYENDYCDRKDLILLWSIGDIYLFVENIEENSSKRYKIFKKNIVSLEEVIKKESK